MPEAQRETSELLLRAVFDHSFEFMSVLRPDGVVLDANRSALEFAGCTRADVVGRHFWETPWFAASAEARARVAESLARFASGD